MNKKIKSLCGVALLTLVFAIPAQAVTIDWYVGWTLRTTAHFGNASKAKAKTFQNVSIMNRTHNRSKTGVTIRGRRFVVTRFNDTVGNLLDHQNALVAGRVNDQRREEKKFKCDLNTLVSKGGGSNGWGQQPGAYNTVNMRRLGLDTVTHELGHNLNGAHNKANRVGGSVGRWTIMYGVGISNRLENFSNPKVKVQGANTGNKTLNNAGRVIARKRTAANRR